MPRKPLDGRRIWFVGIGGAGLSGYALLAREWGAEVGGWDRVETPYLRNLAGSPIEISDESVVPDGWEVVVSTAYAGQVAGQSRADFLAELDRRACEVPEVRRLHAVPTARLRAPLASEQRVARQARAADADEPDAPTLERLPRQAQSAPWR